MGKKRILLVDDEPSVTRTLQIYLEATGEYEVRAENDASQALAVAQGFEPDIIFLDVVMPTKDGATLAAEISTDATLKDVPIVFLTALVTEKEVGHDGRDIGGHSFLAKPIDPEKIVECIEKFVKS
jgi:CheY-like chemotaxis protein